MNDRRIPPVRLVQPDERETILIHDEPCRNCPSAHYPPDPEARDIMEWPEAERLKTAFPCAWRPDKLCRGYWDNVVNPTV